MTPIGLGGVSSGPSSTEVIPTIEVRATGSREDIAAVLVPTLFPADEVDVSLVECVPISSASREQFNVLSIQSSEFYTENPGLNRFDFSIPFSSFSKLWTPGEPLTIGVALFREGQPGPEARLTTARWNNLPEEIHQASTFDFSVTSPRVFGQPVRARIMLWVGENMICIDEAGLRKFAINLQPEPGKIFIIPNEETTPQKAAIQPQIKSTINKK